MSEKSGNTYVELANESSGNINPWDIIKDMPEEGQTDIDPGTLDDGVDTAQPFDSAKSEQIETELAAADGTTPETTSSPEILPSATDYEDYANLALKELTYKLEEDKTAQTPANAAKINDRLAVITELYDVDLLDDSADPQKVFGRLRQKYNAAAEHLKVSGQESEAYQDAMNRLQLVTEIQQDFMNYFYANTTAPADKLEEPTAAEALPDALPGDVIT